MFFFVFFVLLGWALVFRMGSEIVLGGVFSCCLVLLGWVLVFRRASEIGVGCFFVFLGASRVGAGVS